MLELSHIDKYYNPGSVNEMCLFQDFNLTIPDSQFVSVVGSNGSGKTSMLNLICGSISADAGKVIVNGTDITGQKEYMRHRKIGRVYQNPSAGTCPNMTVLENMAVADLKEKGYGLNRCVRKSRENAYREMLSGLGLGLEDKLETKVGSLSGGQRQVLALLMATMTPIDFLILDEHTAALDPGTAEKVLELTKSIVEEHHLTCMMITHNMSAALTTGTRTIMMDEGHVLFDMSGEQRANTSLDDLLKMYSTKKNQAFDTDNMLMTD